MSDLIEELYAMTNLLEEYREKEHIDTNDLGEELINQVVLFDAVADKCARAIAAKDTAEAEVKRIYAALSKEIRSMFDKITEAKLDSEILVRVEYVEALKQAIDVKYQANRWITVKESFYQRASMLTKLVDYLRTTYQGMPSPSTHETVTFLEAKTAGLRARQERNEQLKD